MKRLIFAVLLLFTFTSALLYLYVTLQPKKILLYDEIYSDEIKIVENDNYSITSLEQTVRSNLNFGDNYLFFYSSKDDNSQYFILNVLNPLSQSINLSEFSFLTKIDVVNLIANDKELESLNTLYGITNIPAFAKIEKSYNDNIEVTDVISYDESNPFNEDDIKNWMIKTNSWPIIDDEIPADPILLPSD